MLKVSEITYYYIKVSEIMYYSIYDIIKQSNYIL